MLFEPLVRSSSDFEVEEELPFVLHNRDKTPVLFGELIELLLVDERVSFEDFVS